MRKGRKEQVVKRKSRDARAGMGPSSTWALMIWNLRTWPHVHKTPMLIIIHRIHRDPPPYCSQHPLRRS